MNEQRFGRFIAIASLILMIGLSACSASTPSTSGSQSSGAGDPSQTEALPPPTPSQPLPDLGLAPEISNPVWLNSDQPITLSSLRGKVVLIEFWTFGCINCKRVIPRIRDWYDQYDGEDFTIISIHYPEFGYEEDLGNVQDATERLDVRYPVAIDNDGVTWRAYNQRYWPTRYLVDKRGHIRYQRIGEGAYDETEAAIIELMAEPVPAG